MKKIISQKFNSLTAKNDNFSKKDNLTYKNFENDVLRIIEQNPTIKFIIYLPPYSLAHQKINFINQDYFLEDMNFRGYMIKQLIQHKNVEIYDFETIEWIVSDLNNYKDIIHFSREINDFMVKSFHTGAHRIKTFEDLLNSQRSFAKLPVLDFK